MPPSGPVWLKLQVPVWQLRHKARRPDLSRLLRHKTWHMTLQKESDFIEIPGEIGVRFTPMALTQRTQNKVEANQFIAFLKSTKARQIFEQHGWY